jgi:hypothetical protein
MEEKRNYNKSTLLICKSFATALRSLSRPLPPSKALINEACPSSTLETDETTLDRQVKSASVTTNHLTERAFFSKITFTVVQEKRTIFGNPNTGSIAVFSQAWVFGSEEKN